MNPLISIIKEEKNSFAGLQLQASCGHMTKSDAMGDKYGLAVKPHKGRSVVYSGQQ